VGCAVYAGIVVCLGLTLIGMPGNWLMVAAAAVYWLLAPAGTRVAIGGQTIGSRRAVV